MRAQPVHRRVAGWLPKPLAHRAVPERTESGATVRRRRRVVTGTVVAGTGLLGLSLSTRPNSREFYLLTAATAATWVCGARLSGPLHLGWIESRDAELRRPRVVPVLTGVAAFAVFYGCALVARRIPVLDRATTRVLSFADQGRTPAVVLTTCANGLAEEVFFRGALYSALGTGHQVWGSSLVYTAVTTATRNPSLVLAGGLMSGLFGLQRRASGGIQAPALTHITWSVLMLRFLPPLFRRGAGEQAGGEHG